MTRRDALVPGLLLLLGLVELLGVRPGAWPVAAASELVACLLLVARRAYPLASASLSVASLSVMWLFPQLDDIAAPIGIIALALFALGRWAGLVRGLVGSALAAVLVSPGLEGPDDLAFVAVLMVPPFALGTVTRRLAEQAAALAEHEELVREEAARDERDRIAGELHDLVAHAVSAMVIQTLAAQDLVRTDPIRARAALGDVADTGRHALTETGRLLRVIRDHADELGIAGATGAATAQRPPKAVAPT